MGFEIASVRAGGQEMNCNVMSAMGGDRQIERFGQSGNFHEYRDPAAIRDIRFRKRDPSGTHELLKIPQGTEIFPSRDRNATIS